MVEPCRSLVVCEMGEVLRPSIPSCSEHATCDVLLNECECNTGYHGDGYSCKYKMYRVSYCLSRCNVGKLYFN